MFRTYLFVVVFAIALMSLLNCSDPGDAPLKWTTIADIPVANKKFNLKEELTTGLVHKDSLKVVDPDISKLGDTLAFSQKSTNSTKLEVHEDTIKKQTHQVVIGPIPLTNTKSINDTVPLPIVAGDFSISEPLTVDNIYEVTFYDTVINVLSIKVDNVSSSGLTNVAIGIAGVDTQTISSLGANSSATVNLQLRKKTLGHTISLIVSGVSPNANAKKLVFAFSFNGLFASKCKVDDHIVKVDYIFNGDYDITDTIAMDYIDIAEGFFDYNLKNNTGLPITINVEHHHLWVSSYCEGNNFESINDLEQSKPLDSLKYRGNKINKSDVIPPKSSQSFATPDISADRLFTSWDPVRKKTVTSITYTVGSVTKGDVVTLSSTDSLSFTITCGNFKFKEFLGTVMEQYVRNGDVQKIAIKLPKPWNESMKDSLRGKVVFEKVNGNVHSITKMSERSFIDTLGVSFTAIPSNNDNIRDSTETKFLHVVNDSTYNRTVDITNVTNQFPDTVIIRTTIRIPKQTRMRVCNDLTTQDYDLYNKYIGQMTVQILTNYELNPRLDWEVVNQANLDLGGSKFEVVNAMRIIRKLENRRVLMNIKAKNNSNLNLHIYGIIAPKQLMDTLHSMSTNEFSNLIFTDGAAEKRGFVNFLGSQGVLIPQRDSTKATETELNNSQLETILYSDTCSWRWLARFEKQGRDALADTDYIYIQSKMRIEGTNSTDSLMIW